MDQDDMYIYQMIPKLNYTCVVCVSEHYIKSQNNN
jgi:hypothetical protein